MAEATPITPTRRRRSRLSPATASHPPGQRHQPRTRNGEENCVKLSLTTNHDYIARDERATNSRRRDKSGKSKGPAGWRCSLRGKRGLGAMLFMGFAAVVAIGVPLNAVSLFAGRPSSLRRCFRLSLLAQPPAGQAAYAPHASSDPAKAARHAPKRSGKDGDGAS